jgi:hypothetical protein
MSRIVAYRNNYEKKAELTLLVSMKSFKQLVRKMKSKTKVKNAIAYYTEILNRKYQEYYFDELYELGYC